ncbi:MAG: G8 domain-containing protein, partial [Dokdonella sp.]
MNKVVWSLLFLLGAPGWALAQMHLIGAQQVTHTVVADGSWFDSASWDAGIPGPGAVAWIPAGRTIHYDEVASGPIQALLVEGELGFAVDRSSTLILDTLEVGDSGRLRIGTRAAPVRPEAQVRIVFTSAADIDTGWDPRLLSRGLIAHGQVEIHGARKTVHGKVQVDPIAGQSTLQMATAPEGWRVGDTLVLTGTRYSGWKWDNDIHAVRYHGTQDEVVTIAAISGATITLSGSLQHDHATPRADLKASVANVSRNVRFETDNGASVPIHRRAHVMLMHHTDNDVRYAEFNQLGRTDKSVPSFDPDQVMTITPTTNLRGRYPLHLHMTGIDTPDRPSMLIGNAVFNSPGWGYVHHASNAVIHNNASFDTHGAGFVAETGDEIGSWTDNIAIRAKGNSAFNPKNGVDVANYDIGRTGAGFWFQGRMVRNVGNVAASVNHGYVYLHRGTRMRDFPASAFSMADALPRARLVDPDKPPILNFHGNEALASTVGLYVVKANPNQEHDIHTHISDFLAWEIVGGMAMEYTSHYLLEDIDIVGKTSEPFSDAAFGIEFFTNASDMVVNRARIARVPVGVRLDKGFTDPLPVARKQYVTIDVGFENVAQPYEDFDPAVDRILTSADLVPGRFDIDLNNGLPLEYNDPSTAWGVQLDLIGSKLDSIGTQPIPAGTDWLGLRNEEMIALVSSNGYYRSGSGEPYAIAPFYSTNRADGMIHKQGLIIRLGPNVEALLGNQYFAWRDAFERGTLNLASSRQLPEPTLPASPAT